MTKEQRETVCRAVGGLWTLSCCKFDAAQSAADLAEELQDMLDDDDKMEEQKK